jgi:hypothetical protein
MKSSPSSSEGALTSLRLDLPLHRSGTANSRNNGGGGGGGAPPTVDSFLANLGDPGRFQVVVMFLRKFCLLYGIKREFLAVIQCYNFAVATNCIPVVVNHLLMAFYAVKTPHNCRVPDDFIGNKSFLLPHAPDDGSGGGIKYEQCEMYVDSDDHSAGTKPCVHGYEFHFQDKEWNIIAEVSNRKRNDEEMLYFAVAAYYLYENCPVLIGVFQEFGSKSEQTYAPNGFGEKRDD